MLLKKWRARGRKNVYGNKKLYKFKKQHVCQWVPDTIFKHMAKWRRNSGWICLKCHSWTSWLWRDDLPELFNCEPYISRTREKFNVKD